VPGHVHPLVVSSGGEPLLQPTGRAADRSGLRRRVRDCRRNERHPSPPPGIDWLTVSPKAGTELKATTGDELKLVYPQTGAEPEWYVHLAFGHFYLQPMDGPDAADTARRTVAYCLAHPHWRLSVQVHNPWGIPYGCTGCS
jgi:7-carboxy-7-deazaguanine synthase